MKKLFCVLMIGVLALGMVSPVFAEEVVSPSESEILPVSPEEPVGGDEENGSDIPAADSGDSGSLDDNSGLLPDVGSEPEVSSPDGLVVEDGGEVSEEEEPFVEDTGSVHINADAVYLTSPEEAVVYSVGDVLSGGAFFEVDTSELGNVKIYIPIDYQEGSFAYDNYGNLVNIRASTITGYILDGTQYSVRWTSFGTPQYRLLNYSGVGSSYNDLTVESVSDTNVQIIEDDTEVPLFPDTRFIQLLILLCLGVIVVCQFMRA